MKLMRVVSPRKRNITVDPADPEMTDGYSVLLKEDMQMELVEVLVHGLSQIKQDIV